MNFNDISLAQMIFHLLLIYSFLSP